MAFDLLLSSGMTIQTEKATADSAFDFTDTRRISRLFAPAADPNVLIASQVGPEYWTYRRRWEQARTFQERPVFPLHVDYEPVFACNLRCPICIMSLPESEKSKWGDPNQKLSFDMIRNLIDEGVSAGQCAVGLNGICEPLLFPELDEIVRYARKAGILDVMFNTNGVLLDEEVSRKLIEAGLTRLMISLDAATPETYHQARPGSDFHKVTGNIRRFIKIRQSMNSLLPLVRVNFCVTSINEHELNDFIRIWEKEVDFFSLQHYGNTFEGAFAHNRNSLFPQGHTYDRTQTKGCGQPWKRVMVRHNGDVIPCCDASGLNLVIGNIHEESLQNIWLGDRAQRIRTLHREGRFEEEPICRACMTKWEPHDNI